VTWLTLQQRAGLSRAIGRRSQGQVSLPDVRLTRAEAIALWQDLVASFAAPSGRLLTPRELAQLRSKAWARSEGYAALNQDRLSLSAGLAFWRVAVRLGDLAERRQPGRLGKAAQIAVVGFAATQLAACTSLFGGNIKGSFACSAPGGTCAPSTVIDDQALSAIQNARPMTPVRVPAGPYFRQPNAGRPVTAALAPSGSGRFANASEGMVHRQRRVLKVVFPSFVDGGGNLHEPRIIHAVVDDGGWMELSAGALNAGDQVEGRAVSLASAALLPAPALPVAQDEVTVPTALATEELVVAAPPSQEAVAAARAKDAALKSGNPIDAIRAEVQARLTQTTKAPVASAPVHAAPAAPLPTAKAAPAQVPGASVAPAATPANGPAAFPGKVEE
jgi:conjugal transfer pilus assembly protein TraV